MEKATMTNQTSNSFDDEEEEESVFEAAKRRWLRVEEIIVILQSADEHIEVAMAPPTTPPPSGTLILYDRLCVRNYKIDGYEWIRKKSNPRKIREDHVKLRYQGEYRIGGNYVHSADIATLHRRAYRLIETPKEKTSNIKNGRQKEYVLVHYLDTDAALDISSSSKSFSNAYPEHQASAPSGAASSAASSVVGKKRPASDTHQQQLQQQLQHQVQVATHAYQPAFSFPQMDNSKRIRTAGSYAEVLLQQLKDDPHFSQQQPY